MHGPWIQVDETIYAKLGLGLWRHGRLDVLGGPTGFYSLLYPAFAGLPLVVGGMRGGAEALRVLQAVTVSLTAIPVYFWAKSLAPRRFALAAAALSLAPAGLVYAGTLMTEALSYPLLVCACWAIARVLEKPGRRGGAALAVVLVAACCATRVQAIVLLPAAVTAAVLLALAERRPDALRWMALPAGALAAAGVAWLAWRVSAGKPLLGSYEAAAESSYTAGGTLRYIGYHLGDLILVTGVFPLCAVALLGVQMLRGREPTAACAYTATALAVTGWTVVQVAAFASVHVGFVAERNVFTLAPVLFVGLAAWLGKGAPRPAVTTALVGAAALGLCATLPVHRLLTVEAMPFAPSSTGPFRALGGLSAGAQQGTVLGAAAAAIALFCLLPRRALWALPGVALAVLAVGSIESSRYVAEHATQQQARFVGPDPGWVDRAATGPVAYIYDGDPDWDAVWANLFWNERITRVIDFPVTFVPGAVPQQVAVIEPTGVLALPGRQTPPVQYAVIASNDELRGTPVADAPQQIPGQQGLRLWKLEGPLALSTTRGGLKPNGDIYGDTTGTLVAYGCVRGGLRATLISKQDQTVEIRRDGVLFLRLPLQADEIWRGVVPVLPATGAAARAGRRTCRFDVRPSGLLGTTVFSFERG